VHSVGQLYSIKQCTVRTVSVLKSFGDRQCSWCKGLGCRAWLDIEPVCVKQCVSLQAICSKTHQETGGGTVTGYKWQVTLSPNKQWDLNGRASGFYWFQTFAVSWMLCSFWVIPRSLNFICPRFETFSLFRPRPMKMEQSVSKRRHVNLRHRESSTINNTRHSSFNNEEKADPAMFLASYLLHIWISSFGYEMMGDIILTPSIQLRTRSRMRESTTPFFNTLSCRDV
jgi:hypothetical protein